MPLPTHTHILELSYFWSFSFLFSLILFIIFAPEYIFRIHVDIALLVLWLRRCSDPLHQSFIRYFANMWWQLSSSNLCDTWYPWSYPLLFISCACSVSTFSWFSVSLPPITSHELSSDFQVLWFLCSCDMSKTFSLYFPSDVMQFLAVWKLLWEFYH